MKKQNHFIIVFLSIAFFLAVLPLSILGVEAIKNQAKNTPVSFTGGVVPHHELAKFEIERFWKTLRSRVLPETIVLIGPDHFNRSAAAITTTLNSQIFLQQLDTPTITKLQKLSSVSVNPGVIENEYSLTLHLPIIQKLFPEVKIIPLTIRSDANKKQLLELSTLLKQELRGNVAVIASVDFSHYYSKEQADFFDIETLAALQNFDYNRLLTFGPEHTDSEEALIVLSETVCPEYNCSWETYYKGNSAQFPNTNPNFTTSYFSLFLKK